VWSFATIIQTFHFLFNTLNQACTSQKARRAKLST